MNSNKISRFAAVVLVAMAVALPSCNIYKKFELPTKDSQLAAEYAQALQQPIDSTALGNLDWRTVFTDPVLQGLIEQALANNADLETARLNVDVAQAQLKGAKLSFLPAVSFGPNGALSKYHIDGAEWSKTYTLPLTVSWEADIFGKLLNSKRGAKAAVLRSEAYQQAVCSQIIAAVANCYYTIAALESQLGLTRQTAENWRQSVEVMKNLKEAGRVTEAAVVQSSAQYNSIQAQMVDIETALVQANNSMSLLLNTMPQTWTVPADAQLAMPGSFRKGVPMRQLASRPDIVAAEQALAAAYYTTAGARAAFYPSLNITSNGGFTNAVGSMIMNPGKWFIQLAASLTAPIFSRGANISRLEAAKAQQKIALNSFEQSILSASADVSNALTAYENNRRKEQFVKLQTENLAKAVDYTTELLKIGGYNTTYLEVLTAQQNLLGSQLASLQCQQANAAAIINLYQCLGGGRNAAAPQPSSQQ